MSFWSNPPILLAKVELSRYVFATCLWTSNLKRLLLRAFLENVLNMFVLEQPSHTFGQSGAIALCFFTFSWTSNLKHLLFRVCFEDVLPEMLSKVCVLAERSMKKSQKHHTIAPAALGGCGGLGQLWEALAELWEALGELWEGLYIEKPR